jgi:hypothetical protein
MVAARIAKLSKGRPSENAQIGHKKGLGNHRGLFGFVSSAGYRLPTIASFASASIGRP